MLANVPAEQGVHEAAEVAPVGGMEFSIVHLSQTMNINVFCAWKPIGHADRQAPSQLKTGHRPPFLRPIYPTP